MRYILSDSKSESITDIILLIGYHVGTALVDESDTTLIDIVIIIIMDRILH